MQTTVLKTVPFCNPATKWLRVKTGKSVSSIVHCTSADKTDINSLPLPKGRMGWPVIGRTLEFQKDPDFTEKAYAEYGPVVKMNLFGENTALIAGIENIRKAVYADPPVVEVTVIKTLRLLLGPDGILFKNGKEHDRIRGVVRKTITPSSTAAYIPYIAEIAKRCLETMAEADGTVVLQDHMQSFSYDVAVECMIGIGLEGTSREELLKNLVMFWKGFNSLGIELPFTNFSKSLKARDSILEQIRRTMKTTREKGGGDKTKVLQMLLEETDESGKVLEDKEIEANLLTLLAGGFDTSAITAMSALYELQQKRDVVEQAIKEQHEVIEKYGEKITKESLGSMPYLDAIIKETLRVNATFKWLVRRCLRSFEVDGYRIPEGWTVLLSVGTTGKILDDRWRDDSQFDPSRFLAENGSKPGSQVPWGIGPHNCVGQIIATLELKILFALMFRGYDFQVKPGKKPIIGKDFGGMPTIITRRRP